MRKFIIITKDFSGYGFKFLNEGDEVIFARNPDFDKFKSDDDYEKYMLIGKGMADVFELEDVMNKRQKLKDYYFVWDGNHSIDENELLKKEGYKVCLGGKLSNKLENNREFAIELSEKIGIESPLWESFKTGADGIKFLKSYPNEAFFLKPNAMDESHLTTPPIGKDEKKSNLILQKLLENIELKNGYILQKKVTGTEVNLEYFCVAGEPKSANINLEVKRISEASLMNGYEKGSLCGCAYDVGKRISMDNKLVKMTIAKLLPFLKENNFTGFADMNFIIGENDIWFLEFCFRCGYNAHPNYFMNVSNIDFLNTIADMVDKKYSENAKRGWGASVTIYTDHPTTNIPIDIDEEIEGKYYLFDGYKNKNDILQTGNSNEIMIVGGYGNSIEESLENAYENISYINIIKSDYRSDGLNDNFNSSPIKRWRALEQLGFV